MRKKIALIIFISFFVLILFTGTVYFSLAKYYEDGFSYGTWINGIYCTGKSVEEVNEELLTQFSVSEIKISFDDGATEVIALDNILYSIDYKAELELYREKQNPNLWILNFWNEKGHRADFLPSMSFDTEKLFYEVEALSAVKQAEKKKNQKVEIVNQLEITEDDNAVTLFDKLSNLSADMVEETLDMIEKGATFKEQNESEAT